MLQEEYYDLYIKVKTWIYEGRFSHNIRINMGDNTKFINHIIRNILFFF